MVLSPFAQKVKIAPGEKRGSFEARVDRDSTVSDSTIILEYIETLCDTYDEAVTWAGFEGLRRGNIRFSTELG